MRLALTLALMTLVWLAPQTLRAESDPDLGLDVVGSEPTPGTPETGTPTATTAPSPKPQTPTPQAASAESPQAATGSIPRASFTTAVVDREPQDSVSTLTTDETRIFYFTEIAGLDGRSVVHRWEFDGTVMAEVPFQVGGSRWRVYSSKSLLPGWIGEWKVTVVDDSGNVLRTDTFTYAAAEADASPTPDETPSPPAAPLE